MTHRAEGSLTPLLLQAILSQLLSQQTWAGTPAVGDTSLTATRTDRQHKTTWIKLAKRNWRPPRTHSCTDLCCSCLVILTCNQSVFQVHVTTSSVSIQIIPSVVLHQLAGVPV